MPLPRSSSSGTSAHAQDRTVTPGSTHELLAPAALLRHAGFCACPCVSSATRQGPPASRTRTCAPPAACTALTWPPQTLHLQDTLYRYDAADAGARPRREWSVHLQVCGAGVYATLLLFVSVACVFGNAVAGQASPRSSFTMSVPAQTDVQACEGAHAQIPPTHTISPAHLQPQRPPWPSPGHQ